MDACIWLLENDVKPERIRWIPLAARPVDRGNLDRLAESFEFE